MRFGGTLARIVRRALTMDPTLGPVYLRKVDLSNAYMHLWVIMEYTSSASLLLPNLNPANKQLVGFHLSLPMGFMDSAPYFFMVTETVTDLDNQAIPVQHTIPPHLLERDTYTHAETDDGYPDSVPDQKWKEAPQNRRAADLEKWTFIWKISFSTVREATPSGKIWSGTYSGPSTRCSALMEPETPLGKTQYLRRKCNRRMQTGTTTNLYWGGTLTPSAISSTSHPPGRPRPIRHYPWYHPRRATDPFASGGAS